MTVPEPDRDPGAETACTALLAALPDSVADQPRREVEPADAWGAAWGDPAIVLRCGGPAPAGFDDVAACTTVNGVDWFVDEDAVEALRGEAGSLPMSNVNREVTVEVSMPEEYWPPAATLADLSGAVSSATRATGSCV